MLGDATPGITALVAGLPGIEKFTDDERADLISGMAALLAQAGSVIQADLAPLMAFAWACEGGWIQCGIGRLFKYIK